jgi:hypothetical protein
MPSKFHCAFTSLHYGLPSLRLCLSVSRLARSSPSPSQDSSFAVRQRQDLTSRLGHSDPLRYCHLSYWSHCGDISRSIPGLGSHQFVSFSVLLFSECPNICSSGMWGCIPMILLRSTVALMWTAISVVQAGGFLENMISAIWPKFPTWNHLPADANITSAGILCIILYWFIQTAVSLQRIDKLRCESITNT